MSGGRKEVARLLSVFAGSSLPDEQWRDVLALCDRTQLTPYLGGWCPEWVRADVTGKLARVTERQRRLSASYHEIASALNEAGVPFVLLKGVTHAGPPRMQYDLDLLCRGDVGAAAEVLQKLGYAPHGKVSLSDQHPPPYVRPFDWKWRGDYFDPEMPISVDLHDSPWTTETDHIDIPDAEKMWERRTVLETAWGAVPALCDVDRLGFAALHVLRHILRNDAKPAHVYELALTLDARRDDGEFWTRWRETHSPEFRCVQAIAFRFAQLWFGAAWSGDPLSARVEAWFADFGYSPLVNLVEPNKDVIWLQWALVRSGGDRLRVLRRRLVPGGIPVGNDAAEPQAIAANVFRRAWYHARALAPALLSGARWWWRSHTAAINEQTSDRYRSTLKKSVQR